MADTLLARIQTLTRRLHDDGQERTPEEVACYVMKLLKDRKARLTKKNMHMVLTSLLQDELCYQMCRRGLMLKDSCDARD